jgi:hypothetical protein
LIALAVVGAVLTGYLNVPLPQCTFKTMTGLPCAFCGATRSLRAIGHFHFGEAFWFNPLVTLTVIAAEIAFVSWAIAPQRFQESVNRIKRLPLLVMALTLVALNWFFVLKFLPR